MLIVVVITIFVVRFILFIIFFCCCFRCYCCCFFHSCRRHTETRILTHPIICDVGDIDPLTKNTSQILAKMSDWRSLIFVISTEFLSLFHDAHFMRKSILSISQSVLSSKWFFFLVKKDMFRTQRQHVARGFKFQIIAAGNSLYHNVILSHIEHQSVFFVKPQSVFLEKRGHKYY